MIINSDEGIYSIALSLLYVLKSSPEYGELSQLSFVLDRKNFNKLIDYFGGMTLTIPTREEVNNMLKALVYYQARYIEGFSPAKARELSGVDFTTEREVNKYSLKISEYFDSLNEDNFDTNK